MRPAPDRRRTVEVDVAPRGVAAVGGGAPAMISAPQAVQKWRPAVFQAPQEEHWTPVPPLGGAADGERPAAGAFGVGRPGSTATGSPPSADGAVEGPSSYGHGGIVMTGIATAG
jgi:hypothetical protein